MKDGKAYEEYVAYWLKMQGFTGVHLTSKTGDFGADIRCFDLRGVPCAVQCKHHSKPVGYKAVEEAFAGASYYKCQRALLITNYSFTKNARKGATQLGVELYIVRY